MEDTFFLLPSEVARLVYGHLKHLNCDDIAEKFLNMSPHMKECLQLRKKNRTFMTKAHGLSLEEIFEQFLNMHELVLGNVNPRISDSDKKFHDSVAALKYVFELKKSKDTTENYDLEQNNGNKLNLNTSKDEVGNDISLNLRSSPEDNLDPKTNQQSKILNLYYSELGDSGFDCTNENNDQSDEGVQFPKDALQTKLKSGIKILRPRNSVKLNNSDSTKKLNQINNDGCEQKLEKNDCDINNKFICPSKDNEISISIVDKNSQLEIENSPLVFNGNKNTSRKQMKSAPTKTSTIICEQSVPDVNETSYTRQLRSSSVKTPDDTNSNGSSKIAKLQKNRKKSSISLNDDSLIDAKQKSNPFVDAEPPVDLALMHQKLIENSKLHDFLATNINKEIKPTCSTSSKELNIKAKKVADETLNDPLGDDIINELLACVPNNNLLKDNMEQEIDFPIEISNHEKEMPISENSEHNPSITLDTDITNSTCEEMREFIRFHDEHQSDVIIVQLPQNEQNVYSEHEYTTDDQNIIHLDSITSTSINSSDIANTNGNKGNVINTYSENKREDVIQLHSVENNGHYVIGQNIPMIFGNNAKIMINEKRTRRTRYQPLTASQNCRKWTPIAPKPCSEESNETQINNKIIENISIKSKSRPVKKMKK